MLVPILDKTFLDLMKGGFSAETSSLSPVSLGIEFISAFIPGFIACSWMINLVKKGKLIWFVAYCLIVGTTVLIFG